jgi:hypothetical protein
VKLAVVPVTLDARFDGAPGGETDCGTVTVTLFDSGPVPLPFVARTLNTNVPFGAAILNEAPGPIGTVATTGPPADSRPNRV